MDLNAIIQSHVDLNAIIQSHVDLNAIIQSHMDLNAIIQSLKCFLTCSPIILNISFPIMYLLNDLYIHDLNCTMFIMKFAYLRWQGLHLCIYFVSKYMIYFCVCEILTDDYMCTTRCCKIVQSSSTQKIYLSIHTINAFRLLGLTYQLQKIKIHVLVVLYVYIQLVRPPSG